MVPPFLQDLIASTEWSPHPLAASRGQGGYPYLTSEESSGRVPLGVAGSQPELSTFATETPRQAVRGRMSEPCPALGLTPGQGCMLSCPGSSSPADRLPPMSQLHWAPPHPLTPLPGTHTNTAESTALFLHPSTWLGVGQGVLSTSRACPHSGEYSDLLCALTRL